jgi:hypothetical protein
MSVGRCTIDLSKKEGNPMLMSSSVWKVEVDYGSGYGWIPVSWSPTFDSEQEANDWINDPDRDWESHVRAYEVEVED